MTFDLFHSTQHSLNREYFQCEMCSVTLGADILASADRLVYRLAKLVREPISTSHRWPTLNALHAVDQTRSDPDCERTTLQQAAGLHSV